LFEQKKSTHLVSEMQWTPLSSVIRLCITFACYA
jgi:hypothetical protein